MIITFYVSFSFGNIGIGGGTLLQLLYTFFDALFNRIIIIRLYLIYKMIKKKSENFVKIIFQKKYNYLKFSLFIIIKFYRII